MIKRNEPLSWTKLSPPKTILCQKVKQEGKDVEDDDDDDDDDDDEAVVLFLDVRKTPFFAVMNFSADVFTAKKAIVENGSVRISEAVGSESCSNAVL